MGEEKPTGADVPYIPKGFAQAVLDKLGPSEDSLIHIFNAGVGVGLSVIENSEGPVTPESMVTPVRIAAAVSLARTTEVVINTNLGDICSIKSEEVITKEKSC